MFQDERPGATAGDFSRSARAGEATGSPGFTPSSQRDPRLDFFRGLALFFIFIDHTDLDVISRFTLRGFAFCDAAEAFIFISGVAAAFAYGGFLARRGPLQATARIYRRIWQLYVAHVFVFVAYTALVAFILNGVHNPAIARTTGENIFLRHPGIATAEVLALGFQPNSFQILPLYMVLLAGLPPFLLLIRRHPRVALGLSAAFYLAEHRFGWTLYLYPDHHPWGFSPLAYQFLFVTGVVCGHLQLSGRRLLPDRRWIYVVAGAIVAVCAVISFSHSLQTISGSFPMLLPGAPWSSMDEKRDLSLLRLVNFLAIAIVVGRLVRRDAKFLSWPLARPVVLCGQNSLHIFCLGILLSTAGSYILQDITDRLRVQLLVSIAGALLMIGMAFLLTWYKQMGRAGPSVPARAVAE